MKRASPCASSPAANPRKLARIAFQVLNAVCGQQQELLRFMLELDPRAQGAEVVPEVQRAGGAIAGEDAGRGGIDVHKYRARADAETGRARRRVEDADPVAREATREREEMRADLRARLNVAVGGKRLEDRLRSLRTRGCRSGRCGRR